MEPFLPTTEALCVTTAVDVAVARDWELRQLDVKQAFIQADRDCGVYMKLRDSLWPQTSWTPVVVET